MYQLHFAQKKLWEKEQPVSGQKASRLSLDQVEKTLLLNWEEHDIECVPPDSSSQFYTPRADGQGAHFVYGIYPNRAFSGLFGFGADIRFRPWGKLEADLRQASFPVSIFMHRSLQKIISFSKKLLFLLYRIRKIKKISVVKSRDFDEFVIECFSPQEDIFSLIIEGYEPLPAGRREMKFRRSLEIKPGQNFFTMPAPDFDLSAIRYIYLYPEGDGRERRLIFTWLDFVKYRQAVSKETTLIPAARVKCVAWDLDNTLWDGTLAESRPEELKIREGVLETVKILDERGIIQTLVSKNTHQEAWSVIERLKLSEYFIYPAINWGQKSENLKAVAQKINIGLDTFALIDDSDFERAEVMAALPQIRVYSGNNLGQMIELSEFDVEVTEASQKRRLSYLSEMKREEIKASYIGSYDDFLRSLEMKMEIFTPKTEAEIARCFELVERSNQLNLSTRRYSRSELEALLSAQGKLCLAFRVSDKFGDYGIVGFCHVDESGENPVIADFVISCRVAQRKVEQTFCQWLADHYAASGKTKLKARFIPTPKNQPLYSVFIEMPFEEQKHGSQVIFTLPLNRRVIIDSPITTLP